MLTGLTRSVLLAHLVLSPLAFSVDTAEPFEFVKVQLLTLTALVLAGLAASALVAGGLRPHPGRRLDLISTGVLLYAGSAVLSTVFSISPRTSVWGARDSFAGLLTVLGYVTVYFATRQSFAVPGGFTAVLGAAVVGTAGLTAYALAQAVGADPLAWDGVSQVGAVVRPAAMMGHANHLGAYLVTALPLVAWAAAGRLNAGHRGLAGLATGLVLGGLVVIPLTLSRGAVLGLAVSVILLLVGVRHRVRRDRPRLLTVTAGGCLMFLVSGGVLVATGFGPELLARLARVTDSPGRALIWRAAAEMFTERPWTGQGLDTFGLAFQSHRGPAFYLAEPGRVAYRAHNEVLQVLATQGVVGGLALAVLAAGIITALRKSWRGGGDRRAAAVVIAAALGGFAATALVGFTSVGLGTLVAVLVAVLSRSAHSPPAACERIGRWERVGLVLGGAAGVGCLVGNVGTGAGAGPAGAWLVIVGVAAAIGGGIAVGVAPADSTSNQVPARATEYISTGHSFGRGTSAALHALVWSTTGVMAFCLVVRPWSAEVACAEGCQVLNTDPGAAVTACRRAVELAPADEFYWQMLAAAAERCGRGGPPGGAAVGRATAREALCRAIALEPRAPVNYINLGRLLGQAAAAGESPPAAAIEAFDRGLALDRGCPGYFREAANAALDLNRPEDAGRYARRCRALFPRFGPARAVLGYLALREFEFGQAYVLLFDALSKDEWDDRASWTACALNLVEASLRVNDPKSAARVLRECLGTEPTVARLRLRVARACAAIGDVTDAEAEYRAVLDATPDCQRAISGLAGLGASRVSP